jgi:hypothetical protein
MRVPEARPLVPIIDVHTHTRALPASERDAIRGTNAIGLFRL